MNKDGIFPAYGHDFVRVKDVTPPPHNALKRISLFHEYPPLKALLERFLSVPILLKETYGTR